jgi:hypothetical protein
MVERAVSRIRRIYKSKAVVLAVEMRRAMRGRCICCARPHACYTRGDLELNTAAPSSQRTPGALWRGRKAFDE